MEELANYEKKYRSLKKKYKTVVSDKEGTDQQLTLAKKRVIRLQKERSFLLDRLLQYEQVSSDSDSSHSSSESSEERDDRPAKKMKKEEPVRVNVGPNGGYRRAARPRVKDTEEQVCIARGKDKPCKSKALQGFKYCWHHAPLDPTTGFIFCQYRDANKRNAKKCNIPVHKDKPDPFCNYHVKRLQRQQNAKTENVLDIVPGGGIPEPEPYTEDVFSDQDDGLDVSGSGEETSPPRFQENVIIN